MRSFLNKLSGRELAVAWEQEDGEMSELTQAPPADGERRDSPGRAPGLQIRDGLVQLGGSLLYPDLQLFAKAPVRPLSTEQLYHSLVRATGLDQRLDRGGLTPRIEELARTVMGDGADDRERALRLETHLRREYEYTLDLGAGSGEPPLERFLFDSRS